ncbi:MAG: ParB/RepB/Spo0J family partition protein [Candidatus Sumerlaeia bacterium]
MASAKKRGLGKGLDALLPRGEDAGNATTAGLGGDSVQQVILADPRQVRPNPRQPRQRMDPERLDDLAQSIREKGVLQPVLVRRVDGGYEIVAGERRVRAAIQAGLERIPILVSDLADDAALEAALIENVQREDLNPMEEARAYDRLIKDFGMTQEAVAKRVGKSRVAVANSLRLLRLSPTVQGLIEEGTITPGHARAILMCKTMRQEEMLVALIVDRGISVREAEEWVRRQTAAESDGGAAGVPLAPRSGRRRPASPFAADLEERLMKQFGLRVRVRERAGGRGRLEFYYSGAEELERLLSQLGMMQDE